MRKSTIGTLLVIYGICGGLFETFVSYYSAYADEPQRALIFFIYFLLNPLDVLFRPSILTILVIGAYPFAVIAVGFYLVTFKKKRKS